MSRLVEELLPPDLPRIVRYRLVIMATLLGLIVAVGVGFGAFAFLGIPRFARASELEAHTKDVTIVIQSIERKLKDIRVDLLEQRMYEAQKQRCIAESPDARRFYSTQISMMHREYFDSTGRNFDIPTCTEVGA